MHCPAGAHNYGASYPISQFFLIHDQDTFSPTLFSVLSSKHCFSKILPKQA
jgi:hypothetical protein